MTDPIILNALAEDLGRGGDITTMATIPAGTQTQCVMAVRENGCLAGLNVALRVFQLVDDNLQVDLLKQDGDTVVPGDKILRVTGDARAILMAERVALNFLGRMSGIASKTRQMVDLVVGTDTKICSTRKTTPGLRMFEKYAVTCGGGKMHRLGLDDAVMIKDNHIAIAGDIKTAILRAKDYIGHTTKIEVEVDTLDQLAEVLKVGVDIILLDNMKPETLRKAVDMIDGRAVAEASGGINLNTVKSVAQSGVDMISVGALTHSAPCLDIGLDY
ncbi:MAG: carboxylating nicotinate-nucleotide diphosphorylase [Gammaproteobacteria bacterium]|nr:carboxylating nicotinate-nucleotide diphosphorylase [Gammaproteobacteria bacterium]